MRLKEEVGRKKEVKEEKDMGGDAERSGRQGRGGGTGGGEYGTEEESVETSDIPGAEGFYSSAETLPLAQRDGMIATKCGGAQKQGDDSFLWDTSANESDYGRQRRE